MGHPQLLGDTLELMWCQRLECVVMRLFEFSRTGHDQLDLLGCELFWYAEMILRDRRCRATRHDESRPPPSHTSTGAHTQDRSPRAINDDGRVQASKPGFPQP